LSHLIVGDIINAKFLWKRIPKSLKVPGILSDIWSLNLSLTEKDYATTFVKIATLIKLLQQDSEKNGSLLKKVEVLHLVLREYHVLSDLKEAY